MNASNDLDRRLDDLLADGPSTAPDRAIGAALDHAHRHPRRPDPLLVLRRDPMGSTRAASVRRTVTLVAAAALLIAVALAAASVGGLFERRTGGGPARPERLAVRIRRAVALGCPVGDCRAERVAGGRPRRPRRRHRGHRLRRDQRPVQDVDHGPLGPGVRGQRAATDIGVANLAGDPASIVLTWVGCPSDTRHVLTIAADGRTMTLDQPVCTGDTVGIERVLVLTFSGPVPAGEVHATVNRIGS